MTFVFRRLPGAVLAGLLALQAGGCVTKGKPAANPTVASVPATATPATPARKQSLTGAESYRVRLSMDERTVELLGVMTPKAIFDLEYLIRANATVETLRLTSPGGAVEPSLGLAALVAERGLTVYVPLYCASACALVLAAGRERLLAPGAQLAYHSASGPLGDQMMAEALAGYGLPAGFIARIQSTPHEDIWRPTLEELRAAGAITGVAPDPAPPRLATETLELAGWAIGRDALLDAFGAAFPERLPAIHAATQAYLAGGAEGEAALAALAASLQQDLFIALPRSSDAALRAYFRQVRDIMALAGSSAPTLCLGVADAAVVATLDPTLLDRQAEIMTEAMTLVFRSYAEQPVTVDRARLHERLKSFAIGLYSDGVLSDSDVELLGKPESNPRRFCGVVVAMLDDALSDPAKTDALRGLALAL